ncbi:hypothetical protein [Catenibacterium mitsuokai]|uniref:hypothetical protein n=1 Tax=Catenibacterium mitsuokai TaxID=100886 RepID=UPI00319E7888
MRKKKFIIGLSIIAVITLYFAYHRFETSIPVEIDVPYGITCTTNRSRMVGDYYSLCLHIKSYKFTEQYINIQIKTYDKNNDLREYSTTYKIDRKIPFKFSTDTKEDIKKVVVSITLTTAFKLVLNV